MRRAQHVVLRSLDAAHEGRPWWPAARAALVAGREHAQYAAALNRFCEITPDAQPFDLLHQRPRGPWSPTESDLRVLVGLESASENTNLVDICVGWASTRLRCYVPLQPCAGRVFPRCRARHGHTNAYWLLNPASVLPVLALDPRPGDRVLDLCASPGGKSFLLAQHADGVHLQSNDVGRRSVELRRALGHHVPASVGVEVTALDGRRLPPEESFDRILLDAPCSTERHLVFSSEATVERELPRLLHGYYPQLQLALLLSGLRALRPGGRLLYCTCSLDRRQNGGVVDAAMKELRGSGFRTVPLLGDFQRARMSDFFEFQREGDRDGCLVVPTLEKNSLLFMQVFERSPGFG